MYSWCWDLSLQGGKRQKLRKGLVTYWMIPGSSSSHLNIRLHNWHPKKRHHIFDQLAKLGDLDYTGDMLRDIAISCVTTFRGKLLAALFNKEPI